MLIRVVHEPPSRPYPVRTELLDIPTGSVLREGKTLTSIETPSGGRVHWFTPDGYYDGWSQGGTFTEQEADTLVEYVERRRLIEAGHPV